MHVSIINTQNNDRRTLYTLAQLRREAQSAAKGIGKVRDYYIEVHEGVPAGATALLAVHVVRKDGLGEIVRVAI